jgi:Arc/MetJ-type ribon-helix-helix transcriptional regulator
MPTRKRTTRTFTISLPPQLAEQVERAAAAEHRTISELFREVFRRYQAQRALKALDSLVDDAEKLGNNGYAPEDVERLVDEVRSQRLTTK